MKRATTDVQGFVLAGGESTRMGRNKALLELGGEPMILRMARLVEAAVRSVTVVGPPETYAPLGMRAIRDDWPGAGPLGGIATALRAAESEWNLIVGCDLPYLTNAWLSYLVQRGAAKNAEALVPMNVAGAEPLCAMYSKGAEAAISLALDRGARKVTEELAHLRVEYIEPAEWKHFDSDGLLFKNMNSMADYEEAKLREDRNQKADAQKNTDGF